MKNIITVLLFALAFTTGANAQETKKDCETAVCCDAHGKKCTAEEIAKCKALGINCATTDKSRTASKDSKACTTNSSCCTGGKTPAKKAKA